MRLLKFLLICIIELFTISAFSQLNANTYLNDARNDLNSNKYFDAIQKLDVCIKLKPGEYEAYFFRGICKYFLNDNIGALQDLNIAVSIYDPFLSDAFHYRSYVKYCLGDYDGSIRDINQVIMQQPTNPKLYVERAFSKLSAQDYNGALADCGKAQKLQLSVPNIYLCKGMAYNALNKFDSALANYNVVLKMDSKNIDVYVRIGMTDAAMANYPEAITQFNKALKLDTGYTLAYYSRAEAYLKTNRNDEALDDFNTVIKYDPTNALAYFNRAVLEYGNTQYGDALADFNKVLQLNPKNIEALADRAKLKCQMNDLQGALSDYDRALELFPYYIEAYYERARLKEVMHDVAGAQADYNLAKVMSSVSHYSDNSQRHDDSTKLSHLTALSSSFNNASTKANDTIGADLLPVFYIAEKENGSVVQPLLLKKNKLQYGNYWVTNKKAQSPIGPEDSSLALLNDQTTDTAVNLTVLLKKAIQKTNMKLFDNAKKDYRRITSLYPDCALAYFAMGIDLCEEMDMLSRFNETEQYTTVSNTYKVVKDTKNEKYQSALNDFTKIIQMEPDFAPAYYNRAFVKYKLQDFNGAIDDYNMALQIDPDMPDAYYNRGLLLFCLSEKVNACQDFSKAGEMGITDAYTLIKLYCSQVLK
ncbi:MAG TPA: tetratricopeptide repeat protein [Bacteroidia bacterium]|nr:tetratricopeptide repeat protein [Bacteroidia bacterium]